MRKKRDPKVGTGKKPKGSGRRLYTDENPKDTVSIKFATPADARATIAKVKKVDTTLIYQKINDLCSFHNGMDAKEIVVKMKEIVPEFKSNNSIFETLDTSRMKQNIN